MSKASTRAKQKWNRAHYTQIKVSAPKHVAQTYKSKCAIKGESMSADLIAHMSGGVVVSREKRIESFPVANRGQRKKTVAKLLVLLTAVRDAEDDYLNNIPGNLRGGERYSAAEHAVETLDAIIDMTGDIY